MPRTLRLQDVDSIPATAAVRDYDQLTPHEQAYFHEAIRTDLSVTVPATHSQCFTDSEVISYTRFLRVDL